MMCAMILLGMNLRPLFNAIAKVESDNGMTSENVYQIRSIYVDDVNRIYTNDFSYKDIFSRDESERMMYLYWKYYGGLYAKSVGQNPTFEILAKMHNRGGEYWKKSLYVRRMAHKYWLKVKEVLDADKTSRNMGSEKESR